MDMTQPMMGAQDAYAESPAEDRVDTSQESSSPDTAQDQQTGPYQMSSDPTSLEGAGADAQNDTPNVTKEEQDQYDTVVTLALNMMYSRGGTATIIMKLGSGQHNISQTIGHTAAMIMLSVKRTIETKKKGAQVADDILFHAGQEVLADLVTIAIGSGLMQEAQREDVSKAAALEGMKEIGRSMIDNHQITGDVQNEAQSDLASGGIKWQQPQSAANQQSAAPATINQPQGVPPTQGQPTAQPPGPPVGGIVNSGAQ
jgi:hypothetical protein